MSSPWGDKKKKKAVTGTSNLASSSAIQGNQGTVNGSVVAARAQRQVK
jgi:hypothetical protein